MIRRLRLYVGVFAALAILATEGARAQTSSTPDFGDATVESQQYFVGTAASLQLPAATGGVGAVAYTLAPNLPRGLALDAGTRRVSGTPQQAAARQTFTWTATDSNGDAAQLSFSIAVAAANAPRPVRLTINNHADGNYTAGETILAFVSFDRPIAVTGTLHLALNIGSHVRQATSGGATATDVFFRYTVTAADFDGDGIGIGADALTLNGGTIADANTGVAAALGLGGYAFANAAGHAVNDSVPAFAATDIADKTLQKDAAATFALPTATGGNGTLAYATVPRLPAGLALNAATAAVTGTPTKAGKTTHVLKATDADGDAATLGTFAIHVVPPPAVSGVTIVSSPVADGTYGRSEILKVAVAFDRAVAVATGNGSITVAMDIGGRTLPAVYNGREADGGLRFVYALDPADSDSDGISVNGPIALGGTATIKDAATGFAAALDLGTHAIANAGAHRVNGGLLRGMAATAVSILSTPASSDGYDVGERIEVEVAWPRTVDVTGTPQLALGIGLNTRQAAYQRRSATSDSMLFAYTVAAADGDADGISIGGSALALNSGSIRDTGGTAATLALGSHAIANASAHKVFTPPTVTGFTVTSSPAHAAEPAPAAQRATYTLGQTITVRASLDQAVTVVGSSALALAVGGTLRQATAAASSGNAYVDFSYTVAAADLDTDGIGIRAGALSLPGGATIRDADGNGVELDLAGRTMARFAGARVNGAKNGTWPAFGSATTTPLTFQTGVAASVALPSAHVVGQAVTYAVAPALPDGLTVTSGTIASRMGQTVSTQIGGTATTASPRTRYVLTARDGANGWTGGPVRHDTATLPFTLEVTGSSPTVDGLRFLSTPAAANTYGLGEEIRVAVSFRRLGTGAMRVIGAPTLALTIGSHSRQAAYASVDGGSVVFSYVVQAADRDADGIGIAVDALALNGGSIRDAAGADAVLALGVHASATNSSHKVNGGTSAVPTVAAVTIASTPAANGTYKRGEAIEVAVRFDRTVAVTGSPQLAFGIDSGNRAAAWNRAGASAAVQIFRYVVQQTDLDLDGLSIGASALTLNGGTIRGPAAANLAIGTHAIANDGAHKVDGRMNPATQVTGVSFLSLPARGSVYRLGETIRLQVAFSRAVRVTTQISRPGDPGFPQLTLGIGSATRSADFEQAAVGVQAATSALTFAYTVQAGDYDGDGLAVTALAANRSTVRVGGADVALSLGSHAIAAASYSVDARQPQVAGVRIASSPPASQSNQYAAGDIIEAEVTFDLPVATSGAPQLALTVGSNERQMALHAANGSALRFRYTVVGGDSDADGISIGASALALNGGTVTGRDTLVAAQLGLGTYALDNQAGHKVNGMLLRPTVSSWRVRPPFSGNQFNRGETIQVEVTFSEAVAMFGRSDQVTLDMQIGDASDLSLNGRRAHAARVSGATVVFEYTVQQRDLDSNGLSIFANALKLYGDGALRSLGGVNVNGDLRSGLMNSANHRVDGSSTGAPGILRVQWQSQPANGSTYVFGETMTFAVVWNGPISLSGTVQGYLQVGGAKQAATPKQTGWRTVAGVAGTDGRSVEFSYVVQAGDTTEPGGGVWAQWTGLELGSGATLRGTAGNRDAVLTFGSAPIAVTSHGVDGYCRPTPAFVANAAVAPQRWRAGSSAAVALPAPGRYCGFKPNAATLPDSVQLAVTPALPDGLGFSRATRSITGIPSSMSPSTTYTYRLTDTVVGGSASLTFTIEITPNNMPTFGAATVDSLAYVQHSPIAPVTLPAASGGDGALRYTLSGPTSTSLQLPAGIAFAQPSGTASGGTLSGTPTVAAAAATYTLTVRDVDDDQAAIAFGMQVAEDLVPRFTDAVDNQAWTRHQGISAFTLPTASGGNGTVTYRLSPALPAGVAKDASHRISGTPSVALSSTTYTWTATDGDGDAAELIFSIAVEDAPTFGSAAVDDQAYTRHSAITAFTLPTATGGDSPVGYSLSPALPSGVAKDAGHQVSGTPTVALANTLYTWTATDANGDEASVTFRIAVEDAPTFGSDTVPDQTWKRHKAFPGFTLPTASDGDGTLAYTLSPALPSGVVKTNHHEVLGAPTAVLATTEYTWTATDANGDTASLTFDIEVEDAPTFGSTTVPDQSWTRHKAITAFTLPSATDGDGTLTYAISPTWPNGVAKDASHEVSGKPSVALAATHYTWTATDSDGDKTSVTFSVTVADNNVPSFAATVDDRTWTRNAAIDGFTLPTATGGDGAISYALDPALPAGVDKNASHEVSGTPSAAQAAATYTWTATDADDDEAELTFQITVQEEMPTVALAVADSAIAENGGTTTVTATLARASTLDTTVTVTAVAGAYTVGADAEITIAAGDTENATDAVTITAVDNTTDEPNRSTTVVGTASNSRGAGSVTGAALTLTDNDAAPTVALALGSSSIAENGGSTTVTATLSHASSAATTITVTAVSGLYTVGSDATITIPAGSTSASSDTATINAVDDDVDNVTARSGTVTATAQNSQGIGTVTGASLTLTDDEATPTVTLALSEPDSAKPDTINESSPGNVSTVTATLSGKSSEAVTLTVAATAGTNAEAADFNLSATKTLTIAAGATASTGTVTITAANDAQDEPDQQVSVTATVSGGSGVAAPAAATLTIADDDATPTVALALASSSIAENGGSTTVTATLSHASSAATTITVTGVSGLYTVGADATITIAAGSTSASSDTATINAVDDDQDNVTARSGTVTASAQNSQGIGTVTGASLTLTDNEATPTVALALSEPDAAKPDTINESSPGNASTVTATLSGKSSEAVTLTVAATAGTNTQAADFSLSTTKTLTIAAGATASTGTVTITAANDTQDEPDQQVSVTATVSGSSGVAAPAAATLTIADDDATPTVALALASSSIAENGGSTTVTATLNRASSAATTITITVVSGLYTVGADATITIAAGSTSASSDTAAITAVDDDVDNVTARSGTVMASAQNSQGIGTVTGASLTLTDDEATPTVALALSEPDAAKPDTINESSPGNASTVTATLSGKSSEAVTLTVAATAGTNTQAADFSLSTTKTLTIAAGATASTGTVTITAANDTQDEPDQQVSVTATVSGSSGVAAPAAATLTIADDDATPTVALVLGSSSIAENGGSTTVTATLSHTSSAATTITVTSVSGLYSVGADATITIAAGSTSNASDAATINAVDDDLDNVTARAGTVTATAQNSQGIGTVTGASLTLTDDEATPTVALALSEPDSAKPDTINESSPGNASTVTATLSGKSSEAVTLTVAATAGADTQAADFSLSTTKTLTIAAGATASTGTVTVTATNDTEDEPDQQVSVTATVSGSSGVAAPSAATLTIADDDATPTVALTLASSSIAENGGSTTVTATLSRASSAATTITVTAVSGLYTVGSDATITIPAGSTANASDTATIAAVDDDVDNVTARSGTVAASAQNSHGVGAVAGAALTLTDDEAMPTVALALSEPDAAKPDQINESGLGNASMVTATLSGKSSEAVTLTVAATAGTNTQAADFTLSVTKTLTIAAGATSSTGTVTITAAHDTEDEPDQQVSVTAVVSGSSGVAAPAAATLTIADDDGAPTVALSLASSSIAENGGSTTVTATLNRASSAATTVTVTAVSGLYAVGSNATITIPAGSTSASADTATITAVDDDVDNVTARTGIVTANAQNAQGIGPVSGASLTLTDDEATPTVALALSEPDAAKPDTINESSPGNSSTVTATLSGKSSEAVTLTVAATSGANTQAADFSLSATKTLTIAAGATGSTGTVTITATGDTEDEPDQQVSVTATVSGSSGVAAPSAATLTIADDDGAPTVSLALGSSSIAENGGSTTVTATLSHASSAATTITVTSVSGLYAVGADATIAIPAGSTSNSADTATIAAVDDDVDNVTARSGTVAASAQNSQGIGTVTGASLTLTDDEATPTVALALSEPDAAKPDTINESSPGNASTVTATLSGKSSEAVTLTVAATAGTDTQAADFTLSATKTLTIAAGATASTGTVTVTATNDAQDEPDQQVSVTATVSGSSGVAAPAAATLTIADDDGAPTVALALGASSIAENGGSTTVTATLSHASSAATTITVTAVSGLYAVGSDATVTIPAGSTSNSADTATITAIDDDLDNVTARGGTVTASAQNSQGIGAVTGASLTLTDDEATPTVALALSEPDAAKPDTINESSPGNASTVTATLSGKSSEAVTLTVAATAGTDTQAADFSLSATKTLTIAAGSTSSTGTVTITAAHDTEDEPDQQVSVTATVSGSSGVAAPAAATLTIADDDGAPTAALTLASSSIAENGGSTTVTATLNRASSAATTVTVTAVSGLYAVGADATITIPAGSTSANSDTATIVAVDDDVDNVTARSGTVTANAQNSQGVGAVTGASLTLTDDEATPTVTLALSEPDAAKPDTINESSPGNASTVTATLSGKSSEAVTLTVAATAGTDTQATDFTLSTTKTLTIAAGATASTGTVTITAANDTEDEPDQQVSVTATVSGSSGVAAPAAATLTIADDDGSPTVALALASSSIAENGGSTTVTATLNRASSAATTITVTAVSGLYAVGSDATITIPAGSTSASSDTATITAIDDDLDNVTARGGTVTASAQNSQGIGTVNGASLTLTDDEPTPTVALVLSEPDAAKPDTINESSPGNASTVTATLSGKSSEAVTLTVAATAGTDTQAADFSLSATKTLTIAAGATASTGTVTVTATNDAQDEPDQQVSVTATVSGSSGVAAPAAATLTIADDDGAPTVALALASSSIAENGGSTTVTATLSHASSAATTITVTAGSGLYAVGADATITIPAGSTSASSDTATITAVDDDLDNVTARSGTVTANAQNSQGIGAVTGASLTLTDDEATPTAALALSEPDAARPDTINESAPGNASTVTATLSGKSSEAVTLTVAATAGASTQAADFSLSATKTLTIAAGATASAGTVTITAAHDTEDEPDQQVSVTATVSGSSGVAAPAAATLTIADDDGTPTVALALASSSIAENGGSTTVTATLNRASSAATTVTVTAVSGLYTVGADATITIPAGSTSASSDTATISAIDDDVDNVTARSGTVTANAQNSQGVGAVTGASLTLTDDEATPTVALALSEPDAAKPDTINESSPGNVSTITATLSGKSSEALTLTVAAAAGTDTQASDFTLSTTKTLTIAAGATASAGTVTITAAHDTEDEPDQQVSVTATVSGSSGVDAPAAATLTIADDDGSPTVALALASSSIAENGGSTTVTATLDRPSSAATTVTVTAVSGLYAVGADATIAIPAGSTSASSDTATIAAVDDDVDNVTTRSGTVTATAQNSQGIGTVTGASLTLTDDEATPTVALALSEPDAAKPDTINESSPGNVSTITATLSGKSSEAVTLTVAATAGTDTQATDFTLSTTKTLTIAAGATASTGTVTITAANDTEDEPDQQVSVTATVSGSSGVAAPAAATLTIADDDGSPTVALALASSSIAENGGSTTVTATLNRASSAATTVTVTAVSGLYTVGADATITIPAGSTSASSDTATISAIDDDVDNVTARSGTVTANAQNSQGVGAVTGASLTLTDDEATPTVALALSEPDAAKPDTINESSPGNVSTITATLSGKSSEAVTLTIAATAGANTQAADFSLSATKTLTIAAGTTASTGTVTITATNDADDEPNQQVSVTATVSGSSGVAAPAAAMLTIADDDGAPNVTLALGASSIAENGGSTTVTATLNRASSAATTITVSAVSGLYAVGADATITIPAGSTSASSDTATITAVDDDVDNVTARSGTVTASAQNSQGIGTVNGASLTLTDDEATPTVALALSEPDATKPDTVNESPPGNASTITATLSGKSSEAVTLTVAATAGTNTQAADFSLSATKTLTIAAGATASTGTVTITATNDADDEPNQQVSVTATVSGSSGVANPAAATLTIADDDGAPTVTLALASSSIAENGGSTTVTATLNRASSAATMVTVTAVSGLYSVGSDATITIPAGSTANASDTATIAAVDDDVDNVTARSGTVTASAQNSQGIGAVTGASLTLTDDEPTPTVALALSEPDAAQPDTINESAPGNASTVTATLSGKSSEVVTLTVAATAGTNTQAADFSISAAKTLTIAAGATASTGTVTITATNDTQDEPDQQVSVTATVSGSSGVAAPAAATLTIADDDAPPALAIDSPSVEEGAAGTTATLTFAVTLSAASGRPVSVAYADAGTGTATSGTDYDAIAAGTLAFAAGETRKTITVTITGDDDAEGDETVVVQLSSPVNATVGVATGTGTITDGPATPQSSPQGGALVAEAGANQAVYEGERVLLDGSASVGAVAYAWRQTAGERTVALADADTATATFVAPAVEATVTLTFELSVSAAGETATATTTVLVRRRPQDIRAAADMVVMEGDEGEREALFRVQLRTAAAGTAVYDYHTRDGTATAGYDYTAATGRISLAPGQTHGAVGVMVLGDRVPEMDETFRLAFVPASGAGAQRVDVLAVIANDDGGVLGMDDAWHRETDEGHPHMGFVVYLPEPAAMPMRAWYETRDGTAEAGKDYYATQGVIVIEPGQLAQTIWVPVIGDLEREPDETFEVLLTGLGGDGTGGADGDAGPSVVATGTILDNDFPSLSMASIAEDEGNDGILSMAFVAKLSAPSPRPVHVAYATRDVTAKAGDDYEAVTGELTFAPGEMEQRVFVEVACDLIVEGDDRFELVLSHAENVKLRTVVATATILNDDAAFLAVAPAGRVVEGGAKGQTAPARAKFEVTLSAVSHRTVAVGFLTRDGTARSGSDYVARSSEVVFSPGVQSRDVFVTVLDDDVPERDETFMLALVEPDNAEISPDEATAVATIVDDDGQGQTAAVSLARPTLAVADARAAEAAGAIAFEVALTPAAAVPVTVSYETADGNAGQGRDYAPRRGELAFAAGQRVQTLRVPVHEDATPEADETFRLLLHSPVNAGLARAAATGTIVDDDAARLSVALADAELKEGEAASAVFRIALAPASEQRVRVAYRTQDGTARAGKDYAATSGVAEFRPGTTEQLVSVPLLDDGEVEPAETFRLLLASPVHAELAVAEALATIGDDDGERRDATALGLALGRFGQAFGASAVDATADSLFEPSGAAPVLGGQTLALDAAPLADLARRGVRVQPTGDEGGNGGTLWATHPSDWALAEPQLGRGLGGAHAGSLQWASMDGQENALLDFLSRTSFDLRLGQREREKNASEGRRPSWRLWGSGSVTSLSDFAADDGWRLGGSVYATHLGVAATAGRAAFGATLSHGRGTMNLAQDSASGVVHVDLTAALPFLRWRAVPGLDVWAMAGAGRGRAAFAGIGGTGCAACDGRGVPLQMRLLALGVRRELQPLGGFELAFKSDALATETITSLDAVAPRSHRLRLLLDARRNWLATEQLALSTNFALGGRWDGGEAAAGGGTELGGGVDFRHQALGLAVRGSGRMLLGASGAREWGGNLALELDPGVAGLGPSLRLQPTWGVAGGGTDSLWRQGHVNRDPRAEQGMAGLGGGRWDLALGYGLPARRDTERRLSFGLSRDESARSAYRLGGEIGRADALQLRLELNRQGEPPAYGVMVESVGRF